MKMKVSISEVLKKFVGKYEIANLGNIKEMA